MVIVNNKVWAITQNGSLKAFSASDGTYLNIDLDADTGINSIAKDETGHIFIITTRGAVKGLDVNNGRTTFINNIRTEPGQLIACKNGLFNLNARGITDIKTNKTYLPDSSFTYNSVDWFSKVPSAMITDSDNNIWIGYDHGEFGGQIFVFNTNKRSFVNIGLSKKLR